MGDAVGDAVFDAGLDAEDCVVFDSDFWDSNVVCGADEGEIIGLSDEGGCEVLVMADSPGTRLGGVVRAYCRSY